MGRVTRRDELQALRDRRRGKLAKRSATPVPALFECKRCGFMFQYMYPGTGSKRQYCDECDLIRRREINTRNKRLAYQRNLQAERAKRRDRYHLKKEGLEHAWRGVTEEQWVQRWNERPDLFDKLIQDLAKSRKKYPDWQAQLRRAG